MSRFARYVLTPWEKVYSRLAHENKVVGGAGIGAFSIHPHHGGTVTLADGTEIAHGDPVLELHLINFRIRDAVNAVNDQSATNELTLLKHEYQALANMARRGETPDFKAVFGMTLLSPMVRRLGFEVFPAPDTRANKIIAAWQDILRRAYYSSGKVGKNKRGLVEYWMTPENLITRFGS
jgi:hypothetical protein